MNEEDIRDEISQELYWVQYRIKMLDIIQEKLYEMKKLAKRVEEENLSEGERQEIQKLIKNLEEQVKALNSESAIKLSKR